MESMISNPCSFEQSLRRNLLFYRQAVMIVLSHLQMREGGVDCRVGVCRTEQRTEEEIRSGTIGDNIGCLVDCFQQQKRQNIAVDASTATLRLIVHAIAATNHRLVAYGPPRKSYTRAELQSIGIGQVIWQAVLFSGLDVLSEELVSGRSGILRAQIYLIVMARDDDRFRLRRIKCA